MNAETLRQLFQSPFIYSEYSQKIVHDLFGCNDVYETLDSAERLNPSPDGDQNYFLGRMEDSERQLLGFFYTRVAEGSDVRRKRVGLWKLIQPYLKYEVEAAIAVFDDGQHWRLSYIYDHKKGTTSAKRFSYVLGDKQGQYKTPLERLEKVAAKAGRFKLEDLRDAFSVDALSKEFFDEYHRHYDRILRTTVELISKDPTLYSGLSKLFADYIKKMMGRIVFLHFLQKKGWLNGDPEFLKNLFSKQPLDRKEDFLEQVLEPLFFGIFNTEPQNREKLFRDEGWDVQLLEQWKGLPYLNGGLFERDSMDTAKLKLPASLFERLFEFVASYKFTVDENDPDGADIGVDPEMLGKIFESLLEDNKAKGAFYTPKEIVRYMCKESLIAYLDSKIETDNASEKQNAQSANNPIQESKQLSQCGGADTKDQCVPEVRDLKQSIRDFVEQHEFPEELELYRVVLDTALREVKICDPAIGSGAFPMGLLNELWRCREALSTASESQVTVHRSQLKKQIIENNIYGVDIERGAIDIARLRFWLSIVVDAEKPEPLPNFDYKFMQGNSLIESFDGHDLSHILESSSRPLPKRGARRAGWAENQTGMEFGSDEVKQNLRNWLKIYFSLTDHKEKAYYRELINSSVKNYIVQQGIGPVAETRLNAIDPSANKHFFLWHTWFKDIFDNGGFDIVIGNPPYISIQGMSKEERNTYKVLYKFFFHRYDIFGCFIERGMSLQSINGVLMLIQPSVFLNSKSFIKCRNHIVHNTRILNLDLLKDGVFQSAVVPTMIMGLAKVKVKNENIIRCSKDGIGNFYSIKQSSFITTEANVFNLDLDECTSSFIRKTQENCVVLGDIARISRAINVGDYERFLSDVYHDGFIKVLKGASISKWSYEYKGFYLNPKFDEFVSCGDMEVLNHPKLMMKRIGVYPNVCYDDSGIAGLDTIYTIRMTSEQYSPFYIMGLLNSKLIGYVFRKRVPLKGNVFPEFRIFDLNKQIPIKNASADEQKTIVDIVKQIISLKQKTPEFDIVALEQEIDRQVYALYNLTSEEIDMIEQ